jgi:hypothetical protein
MQKNLPSMAPMITDLKEKTPLYRCLSVFIGG